MIAYPLSYGLGPGMTVTRASDGSVRDADDSNGERVRLVGGNNIERISSPDGGLSKMLLVEPARTNYILRSAEVQTAPWGAVVGTPGATGNARVAPDGTTTGCDMLDNDALVNEIWSQQVTDAAIDGQTVVGSIWLKNITSARCSMHAAETAGAGDRVRMPSAATTWTRVSGTVPSTIDGDAVIQLHEISAGADYPDAGSETGTGTASWWGGQLEVGRWPSSYIPTVGSAVARSADACAITTAQLEAHLKPTFGRIKMTWRPSFANDQETGAVWLFGLSAACGLRYQGAGDVLEIFSNSAQAAATGALTFARGAHFIIIMTWNGTAASDSCHLEVIQAGSLVGGFKGTWTPPTLGAAVTLGSDVAGANQAGGHYGEMLVGYG